MSTVDPNRVIVTGENPFIRLSETDGGELTTDASFWRILFSPAGPGHVLYLKSELTEGAMRIYSDNLAMARWLQSTVQGMLNPETADTGLARREALDVGGRRRASDHRLFDGYVALRRRRFKRLDTMTRSAAS